LGTEQPAADCTAGLRPDAETTDGLLSIKASQRPVRVVGLC